MEPPNPLPEFVYKITPTAPQQPIPEAYPLSELDQKDGFVHLSTASQIPTTADLFFASSTSFYLVKLRLANFEPSSVKWDETPGTNGCPHLYGNFGEKDVVDFKEVTRPEGLTWSEALKAETEWLV
ncbi:hypothetical protein QBC34DRAFT_351938 [Podospora aff. communis PSN243]|uniref:DUF952 domain-containing protein n=1 Tax=Podospora aff. communis PSN243 TaxID=3040156 RepID=A0AAV9GNT1_9PEZI|nr:hypothetical protein QBC34DRAFT_351938 [Podospora aff. communis PSN243]